MRPLFRRSNAAECISRLSSSPSAHMGKDKKASQQRPFFASPPRPPPWPFVCAQLCSCTRRRTNMTRPKQEQLFRFRPPSLSLYVYASFFFMTEGSNGSPYTQCGKQLLLLVLLQLGRFPLNFSCVCDASPLSSFATGTLSLFLLLSLSSRFFTPRPLLSTKESVSKQRNRPHICSGNKSSNIIQSPNDEFRSRNSLVLPELGLGVG